MRERIVYSRKVAGTRRNYGWSVRFDWNDGSLGLTQESDEQRIERVLLAPKQVRALVAFLRERGVAP